MEPLTQDIIESFKTAAKLLTGYERRQFQAYIATKHCGSSPRKAEVIFGWGRATVNTGLNELRSGIRCEDNFSARGRKTTEELCPLIEQQVRQIVEPQSQADPKFQTTFAYTRITAKAVRDALNEQPELKDFVPSRQTVGRVLNRLGYRLRRVQKTRPEKKFPKPTPSLETSKRRV